MDPLRFDESEDQNPTGPAPSDGSAAGNRPADGARHATPGEALGDSEFPSTAGADFLGLDTELGLDAGPEANELVRVTLDEPLAAAEPEAPDGVLFDPVEPHSMDPGLAETDLGLEGDPWIADQDEADGGRLGPTEEEAAAAVAAAEGDELDEDALFSDEPEPAGSRLRGVLLLAIVGVVVGAGGILAKKYFVPSQPDVTPVAQQPNTPTPGGPASTPETDTPVATGTSASDPVVDPTPAPPAPSVPRPDDLAGAASLAAAHPLGILPVAMAGALARAETGDLGPAGAFDLLAQVGGGTSTGAPSVLDVPDSAPLELPPAPGVGATMPELNDPTILSDPIAVTGDLLVTSPEGEPLVTIWQGSSMPTHHLHADATIQTPNVGGVRLMFDSGDVFEGHLVSVGRSRYTIRNELGRLTLDGHRVVDALALASPLESSSGEASFDPRPGERVRALTAGGWVIGRVLAEKDGLVTLITDSGGRIVLRDPPLESLASETRLQLP